VSLPFAVAADARGRVFELPGVVAAMRSGRRFLPLDADDLVPLPEGSTLYALPGRAAVGFTPERGLAPAGGRVAVAAFLPPGWSVFGLAAFQRGAGAPELPLRSYAAVCWWRGRFHVPAARVESDVKHDPDQFDDAALPARVARLRERFPDNRVVRHLGENCALRWGCANAKNLFHERWECPVPVAPACNAACVGCISSQPGSTLPPPQDRLGFVPEVDEIVEFAVPHLQSAPRAMVSFGQGCEGEPLLQAERIEATIRAIRRRTSRGTLHLNTNGSRPAQVERLAEAGLDSIRVSLNSARAGPYEAYYRPLAYGFEDVVESLTRAKRRGCFTSVNALSFPGFTDSDEEAAALDVLVARTGLDLIQWRNLNIDPEVYPDVVQLAADAPACGMRRLLDRLRARWPRLRHGYVNVPRESFAGASR
jgi:pyruvate-formate lyase-activating enzyme